MSNEDFKPPRTARIETIRSKPAVDMNNLLREITSEPSSPRDYAQPAHRREPQLASTAKLETIDYGGKYDRPTPTALEMIASSIARLTWTDAEIMGKAITDKMKEGATLTAAMQSWAIEAGVERP
jgi:hypothetical protein